jgi:osmotically-inducible protein OsmY
MLMTSLARRIEQRLEDNEIYLAVEEVNGRLVLSGHVLTEGERETALDVVAEFAEDREIDAEDVEVTGTMPGEIGAGEGLVLDETDVGMMRGGTAGYDENESLEAGDFMEQRVENDPAIAGGPSTSLYEDNVSEGDEVYVPPTDPVARQTRGGRIQIIGGLQTTSMDSVQVRKSALDGQPGDEALADAIRRELLEDAATTDLEIEVEVFERVAVLRGVVAHLFDAENAEEVANRVPGLVEVKEELEVADFD